MAEQELYELKKKLKSLGAKRGRHTELISVYIPDGYDINKITNKLAEEQGTASNIKSASTRKNVTTALTKILQHLKLFKRTPKNGLAVFCGNVAEQEGQLDFLIESIIPPKPLAINLYRCSQRFVLNPLQDMLEKRETYGLIVMDRRRADIALLKGKSIEHVTKLDSMVPGKFRAGGQSAQRFERVIEGMAHDFYKKVAETANKSFRELELKGILIGGPGHTKQTFLEEGGLSKELKDKILGIIDIGYTGEPGLEELLGKSEDILAEAEVTKERQLVNKLLEAIAKEGLVDYGEEEVKKDLQAGAVDTLLLSEGIEDNKMDEFRELAETLGSKIELVSTETREGKQLLNLGGIAALLRFKPNK